MRAAPLFIGATILFVFVFINKMWGKISTDLQDIENAIFLVGAIILWFLGSAINPGKK